MRYLIATAATVALFAATVASHTVVLAHDNATGVVKERMELMERFDELMNRVFAMLRGEIPYDAPTVRKAAKEIG